MMFVNHLTLVLRRRIRKNEVIKNSKDVSKLLNVIKFINYVI